MISSDRRRFLHTAGATLVVPLIGGGVGDAVGGGVDTALARAQSGQPRRRRDPVLAELLRQARSATQKATQKAGQPGAVITGEPVRQVAAALRLLAVHGATIGVDAEIRSSLRSTLAREGRQGLLARRPHANALAAELGLELDASRLGTLPEDYALRAAALDAVLKKGVAEVWLEVAQALEDTAVKLDAQRGVQLVRQGSDCTSGQWALFMLEVTMIGACGPWAIALPEPCAIATTVYITYRLALLIMGCL